MSHTGSAQPLIILAHPSVLAQPREGPLYHPPSRQHPKASRRHKPLPVHLLALLGPLLCPALGHLLRDRLSGACARPAPRSSHSLLGPPSAPSLVAGVYPQVLQAPEPGSRRLQQQSQPVLVGDLGAVDLG